MLDWYVGGRRILGTSRRRLGARGARRGLPRARSVLALAVSVTSLVSLVTASPTRAGTFTADMCEGPAATLIGTAGLQELLLGEAQFVSGEDRCGAAGEQITMQLGPDADGYANLQGGLYAYSTPSGVAISSYTLRLSAYAAPCGLASGHCPGGVGQVFVNHTGELDPHYDFRDLGEGSEGPTTVSVSGLLGVTDVLVGATCDGGCPSAQTIAGVSIPEAEFTLVDSTVPKITARFGPPEGVALSGQVEWSFAASDLGGPGLYRVLDSVDGKTDGAHTLSENGGLCKNLGTEAEAIFASPQPCPVEANGAATLDTNDLADGEHAVHVYVETAGGNSADVFNGRINTANGPIVEEAPTISGVAAGRIHAHRDERELRPSPGTGIGRSRQRAVGVVSERIELSADQGRHGNDVRAERRRYRPRARLRERRHRARHRCNRPRPPAHDHLRVRSHADGHRRRVGGTVRRLLSGSPATAARVGAVEREADPAELAAPAPGAPSR